VSTVAERAERGAALLDERMPGWWQHIDLDRLDIDSPCDCVAGQIGGYTEILQALGLDDGAEYDYGFDGGSFASTRALTPAWRDLILARRAAASVTA
jgi:hypothetical protein